MILPLPILPAGDDLPVAPLWPSILPGIGMIVAGVALLWWKLHRIGMKLREFRALMKNPPPLTEARKRELGFVVLDGNEWRAVLQPFRDDTGTTKEKEAEA